MNKRYMDFVPAKGAPVSRQQVVATKKQAAKIKQVKATPKSTSRAPKAVPRTSSAVDFDSRASASHGVELGVVEDYSPKFIKTTTDKRPLNSAKAAPATAPKKSPSTAAKHTSAAAPHGVAPTKSAPKREQVNYVKSPFINMDKVEKRPLSASSRMLGQMHAASPTSQAIVASESKGAPKTAKSASRGNMVGLVVTIILTIVLGATAGAVAYLLLPK